MNNIAKLISFWFLIFSCILPSCKKENVAPTVVINNPLNDAEIQQGTIVIISVDAEDQDGSIKEVRFYLDGNGIASVT